MNARQKAKYYKRKYESLLKEPVRYKVETHPIDTLRFERYYPKALVMQGDDYIIDVLKRDLANGLVDKLNNYMDYKTEFCPHLNQYRFVGEFQVVRRKW